MHPIAQREIERLRETPGGRRMFIVKAVEEIDNFVFQDDNGLLRPSDRMRIMPASWWHKFPVDVVRTWANVRGRYVIPTEELITWLKRRVNERKCLEIGAGFGDVGRALGIHMTDSAMQMRPEMRLFYRSIGQLPIDPPGDVGRIDGNCAVAEHRPAVVVACFVTQAFEEGDTEADIGSSVYGVDEANIVEQVAEYIHVGNDSVHGSQRIRSLPHSTIRPPWLITRAKDPSKNSIRMWAKKQ